MTVRLRDLLLGLRDLRLGNAPVIVHASMKSFGQVEGGAETVVSALGTTFSSVLVPVFTYKSMLTPRTGPENNAITYGSGESQNRMAEFFTPRLPADPLMGIIPETLRRNPQARRSSHPILSFAGLNAARFLPGPAAGRSAGSAGRTGKTRRLGRAGGRGPYRQLQHPRGRKTGRAPAVRALGAHAQGCGGVPGLPGLLGRLPGALSGDGQVHPQRADRRSRNCRPCRSACSSKWSSPA